MRDLFWVAVAVSTAPPWVTPVAVAAVVVAVAAPVWLWWTR